MIERNMNVAITLLLVATLVLIAIVACDQTFRPCENRLVTAGKVADPICSADYLNNQTLSKLNWRLVYIPIGAIAIYTAYSLMYRNTRIANPRTIGGAPSWRDESRPATGRARLPFGHALTLTNPPFDVRTIKHPRGFDLTLIDESHLIGGSKQRALIRYIADIKGQELVYAGPSSGYAQVAIAYCALLAGKTARVFIDQSNINPLSAMARALGATIVPFNARDTGSSRLKAIQKQAELYVDRTKGAHLLPFGMDHPDVKKLYEIAFEPLRSYKPKRIWVVAGSGMIFSTLSRIWPDAEFMIVQVGKTIWPDQVAGIKHQLFISTYAFSERILETPPYNTLMNYDAKVWPFILTHGQSGDFVWNTAGEPLRSEEMGREVSQIEKLLSVARDEESVLVKRTAEMVMPMFHDAMPPAKVMFSDLKKFAAEMQPAEIVPRNFTRDYTKIDGISNHFSEVVRMNCIVNRSDKISPKGYWNKYKAAIAREAYYLGGPNPGPLDWRDAMNATKCYECGTFNPIILINAIKRYFHGQKIRMLDPSMGWGDRLIGALASDVELYVGFDPNTTLRESYLAIKNELAPEAKTEFITNRFSIGAMDKSLIGTFDLAFTSPPFFDEEIYVGTESDVHGSYSDWLRGVYEPYLRDMAAAVAPTGILAVYIDNVPRIANMANDTTRVLNTAGFASYETLLFRNDHTGINGLTHIGHPRSLWVFRRAPQGQKVTTGGADEVGNYAGGVSIQSPYPPILKYDTTLSDEVIRLEAVDHLITHFNKILVGESNTTTGKSVAYEAKNIVERFLLACANRAAISQMKDPVLSLLPDCRNDPTIVALTADIRYKFPRLPSADTGKLIGGVIKITSQFNDYISSDSKSNATGKITYSGDIARFEIGNYSREIAAARMRTLVNIAGKAAVIKLLVRYACIISGSQHWEAPLHYFKVLYALGVRFEGFASPINSQFIRDEFSDARFCSLFPDVDAPFGSIGGFFQVDFLNFWAKDHPVQVVVGPPYYDELILNIAHRVIDHCDRAIKLGRAIRFIITHSNSWDFSNGFKLLRESEYKRVDHVYAAGDHYYQDDRGNRVIARFATRLFVLDAGMTGRHAATQDYIDTLLTIFPRP
jgi:hypothetical protein